MSQVVRKLGLLFILLDNLFVPVDVSFDFRVHYILYFLFIFYYLLVQRTIRFRLTNLLSIATLIFILFLAPLIKGSGYLEFAKQISLIVFNIIFSYLLIDAYRFDLERIFIDYIQLIYFAAIVGFIQLISQIVGFKYGADYSYLGFDMQNFTMENWKMQSWFQEPSFMAIGFAPVVFVGISRFFNLTNLISIQKAIVIITALILSQSSVGLIGLLLSFAIIITTKYSLLKSPLFIMGAFIILLSLSFGFYSFPQVKLRVDDTVGLFFNDHVSAKDIEKANLSTYSMYSNFKVTQAAFMDSPILGSGLGTYELNYFRYINDVLPKNRITEMYLLNSSDANSMFLRVSAELGLTGILLLGWFLIANRIRLNLKLQSQLQINYWVINSSIFVLFLIRLLRQGHYTMLGFMLFVLMYHYSKKQFEASVDEPIRD